MQCALFLLAVLVLDSVFASDNGMETILAVTRCRASCLDQFSQKVRTENSCQKDLNCLMCWEMCDMLNKNSQIWRPMCSAPSICTPGCQMACQSLELENSMNESRLSNLAVKSVYDISTDRVLLEWMSEDYTNMNGIVLYTVLLRDKNLVWEQIAQTTSHVVHVRGKLINRDTAIRLLAANATHLISYAETTYVNSLIRSDKSTTYPRESTWGPHLISMERSKNSHSLLATITWSPVLNEYGPNEYEISWNVMDDAMEVTGHLVTTKNVSVLTLWPDSIYLVQVKRYSSVGVGFEETSEPLVIDTKLVDNYPIKTEPVQCKDDMTAKKMNRYFEIFFSFMAVSWIIFCIALIFRHKPLFSHQVEENKKVKIPKGEEKVFKCLLKKETNKESSLPKKQVPNVGIYHLV